MSLDLRFHDVVRLKLPRLQDAARNPRWLGYVLLSEVGQTHGKLSLYGGTKDGLSLNDVKNYPLLLPPRDEQDRLVAKIDRGTGVVDSAVEHAHREVKLLNEYRARLIADVVTGKLDVREAAAVFPEVDPLDTVGALNPVANDDVDSSVEAAEK